MPRTLRKLHPGRREDLGDLVTRQSIPNRGLEHLDPFLLLNHHGPQVYPRRNHGLPFGPHPHRGFETVTFIVEGSLLHRDSGGHESAIHAGGVQWMTAGRGLVHAELSTEEFLENGGPLDLLQLWINLPSRLKMTTPSYTGLQSDAIPAFEAAPGVTVHLIAGDWAGHHGPIESLTGVLMSTVKMSPGTRAALPSPASRTIFFYVVRGSVTIAATTVGEFNLVEWNDDGDTIEIDSPDGALLLFGHADAIREPVASYGPFVMNTREEIEQAIADYQSGRFEAP